METYRNSARTNFSRIDFYLTNHWTNKELQNRNKTTLITHSKKLSNLGINNEVAPCNHQKVTFNFSSAIISPRPQTLLAFGLGFCLPMYKLSFYQYFLPLESLVYWLKSKYGSGQKLWDFMCELQNSSFKYFYNFKPLKIFSPISTQGDIQSLKSFAYNKDIIITKPDKGCGVVIVTKNNYINSMQAIISDRSKFIPIDESMAKFTLQIEEKINRFLLKIKIWNIFTADVYSINGFKSWYCLWPT